MAKFTVRIELHDTEDFDGEEYQKLHDAMEKVGFTRTIIDDSGKEYHLPRAEYNYHGTVDRLKIKDLAKRTAMQITKNFSLLVTTSSGRTWYNLKEVKKTRR